MTHQDPPPATPRAASPASRGRPLTDPHTHPDRSAACWLDRLGEQAQSWFRLAGTLTRQGRLPLAGDLLARACELEPACRQLREAAARAQFAAGQYLGAQASFAAMAALDPGDDLAVFGVALCEARLGDLDAADRRLAALTRRSPDVARFGQARACVAQLLGDRAGPTVALPTYQRPPLPIAPQLLALELGERDRAERPNRP